MAMRTLEPATAPARAGAPPTRVHRLRNSVEAVRSLQRTAGNRAVMRLLQREAAFGLMKRDEVKADAAAKAAFMAATNHAPPRR
jgi:hypothetical protein